MDWLAGFRQHPVEIALMTVAQNLPLVVLGLPLGTHAVVALLLQLNTIFVHSNLKTPRALEWVVATPRFHHRHHDRDAPLANYASLFPWIDRLFGTCSSSSAGPVGLPAGALSASSFWALLVAPLRPARRTAPDPRSRADGPSRDLDPREPRSA
jgi:hypothetical protein